MKGARTCRVCGRRIAGHEGKGRPFWYCSVACQKAARRERGRAARAKAREENAARPKTCPICGTRFCTKDGRRMRKYCSPACARVGRLAQFRAFYDRIRKPKRPEVSPVAERARERAGLPPVKQPKTYAEIRAENRARRTADGWKEGSNVHASGGGRPLYFREVVWN